MAIAAAPIPKKNMGAPDKRLDGRQKVTGAALYAADFPLTNPAFGFFLTSAIARGRISDIDTTDAEKVPGVLYVMTHRNRPPLGKFTFFGKQGEASTSKRPLSSIYIDHDGEIIALVVAETFEDAREGANRIRVEYDPREPAATFDAKGTNTVAAVDVLPEHKDPKAGDFADAFAKAGMKVDATYITPTQHHNAIELFATTCAWNGDELTIYEPSQWVVGLQHGIAKHIGHPPEKIRVISPYVGGAFGSKGSITPRTSLVALAARVLGRPVKLVVPRDQGFTIATYRAETKHHIQIGATTDGKLTALSHESWELSSRADDYVVAGNSTTTAMYGIPNVVSKVSIVKADRNTPGFMRSPPEVPYMFALEAAIDEMAVALKIDPLELRRINDTVINPTNGAPYTSRSLMQCFDQGAEAFGWKNRNAQPGFTRDGDWLVGLGCATACYPTQMAPSAARVRLTADGKVRIQVAAHDVGTGAYTVLAQQAAGQLGVDISDVSVELGDSDLPAGPVAGGSVTTASSGSAVKLACDAIIHRLAGTNDPDTGIKLHEGKLIIGAKAEPLADVFARKGIGSIEEYGEFIPEGLDAKAMAGLYEGKLKIVGGAGEKSTMYAFGAEFVEVRVHARTKQIRVPRMVGAFAGGRIMNTRTARSQLMGGMIWGVSSALHEATEIDQPSGRYVNDNLADYLLPVNADIADVEIILVPEEDDKVNPIGVKGIGELANVGTAAAVANAVYNATGQRLRELPIRLDALLS